MSKNKLKAALDALQPIIFVNTVEPVRFRDLFLFPAVAEAMRCPVKDHPIRRITRVSPTSCKRWTKGEFNKAEVIVGDDANWYSMLTEIRNSHIPGPTPDSKMWLPEILWLTNFDAKVNPGNTQDEALIDCLLESAIDFQSRCFKHVLITGTALKVPDILRPYTETIDLPLPDEAEIKALVAGILKDYAKLKLKIDPNSVSKFIHNAKGLSEYEIQQSISTAVACHQKFDENASEIAQDRKQARARASGLLELRPVRKTLSSIGGAERLKEFILDIKPIFLAPDEAKRRGVRIPSGIALYGPPGTGKSASCEAIAGTLEVGFARFSLGALMDKWVGGSEANLREAFRMIEAIAPVVVQFDEVEKMMGSDGAGHATFQMCKGLILTWLEEKPEGVFVAMTMNDIECMNTAQNAAMIREGRVAAVMFVDLPGRKAREEILKIHLAGAGPGYSFTSAEFNKPSKYNKKSLIDLTRGFSGSEIEGVVHRALREMFRNKEEQPQLTALHEAAVRKKPQSAMMKESMAKLRAWVVDGRADMAGEGVEDAEVEKESTERLAVINPNVENN